MLDEIHISDVALIKDASFEPASSLTVVTGETGAGKTALLNAIALLVGGRGDAGMVRDGEDELRIEGRFYFDGSSDEGELVARRLTAQGRSRVSINGSLSSVGDLAAGIGASVDLCGQHEHQRLLRPAHQRHILDVWGCDAIAQPLRAYRAAFERAKAARAEYDRVREAQAGDDAACDRARFICDQIDEVAPREGEYDALLEDMPRYEHAEMLIRESGGVHATLTHDQGVLSLLEQVITSMEKISRVDSSMDEQLSVIRDAYFSLEDVARIWAGYRDSIDFSPAQLEQCQMRLSALQGLMRTYGPRMEDVFAAYENARSVIDDFSSRDERLTRTEERLAVAEAELVRCAEDLKRARSETAPRFFEAVSTQMARLDMGSARLAGTLKDLPRDQWSEWGPHTFELLFVPGFDVAPQKLNQIASGGEISRVMLAIKVVLGAHDEVDTLVFDEIDAGVGGQAAVSLAAVLEDLAKTHQVIVVTHLAQVAVAGDRHYLVYKTEEGTTRTCLKLLDRDEREAEIARMLSGEVTDLSLAHAREMLSR